MKLLVKLVERVSDRAERALSQVESAIVTTLPSGGYTAIGRGQNDTTGVGLGEVYSLNWIIRSWQSDISYRLPSFRTPCAVRRC